MVSEIEKKIKYYYVQMTITFKHQIWALVIGKRFKLNKVNI